MPEQIEEIQLRVPLIGEDAKRFVRIKGRLGIQSNTDAIRFILKRWEETVK
jgi:hypothetical protein